MLLGACAGLRLDVPAPFLRLHTSGDEVKAVTPDDARLWVRTFADPDGGDLGFWSETLRRNLVARGYEVQEPSEVHDAAGRQGRCFRCAATVDGARFGYLVAVFVSAGSGAHQIAVVEFTALEAAFSAHVDDVLRALATLRS